MDHEFMLPSMVVGPSDLARLRRELEALEEFLRQAALRKTGESMKLPRTSRLLDEIAQLNKLNLLQQIDRTALGSALEKLRTKAPVVHISFAVDPSAAFMDKLVVWFRQNIHPFVLLQVGLQPTIAAGCIVRTTNRQFDLSLRQHFAKSKHILLQQLREADAA
jgi:F0F1-type ATP synthase delta subunit